MTVALTVAGVGIVVLGVWQYLTFSRDMRAVTNKLAAHGARVVDTPFGAVQYLERGEGKPVLIVHGIWGGFDQGLLNAAGLIETRRAIYASRFGYLASSMPEHATAADQADALAALLDALSIPQALVIAHSAGSTSALQLALRHPGRVTALVLVSPNAPGPVDAKPPPRGIAEMFFRTDLLFWALTKHAPSALYTMMGVPKNWTLTPEERTFVAAIAATVLPASQRASGAIFDMYVSNPSVVDVPVAGIAAPALVVGARDDPLALIANTRNLAATMPHATLYEAESGGHMLLGQAATVEREIKAFIANR